VSQDGNQYRAMLIFPFLPGHFTSVSGDSFTEQAELVVVHVYQKKSATLPETENEGQVKYRISVSNVENMDQPISVANMRPVPCGYLSLVVTFHFSLSSDLSLRNR
jgi:hypothetical protein